MPRAWYLIRLIFFGLHYAAWLVYSVLSFVSKPGSRRIMPFVFAGILAWYLADGAFIGGFVRGVTEEDGDPLVAYLMLAIGIGLILAGGTYGYRALSRLLALFMNTFPPLRRPLMPLAPIQAPKRLDDPVPATIAVPPLPRPSGPGAAPK